MSDASDPERPTRWSKATVYPDMWVNPDDDPRNVGGSSPRASWRRCRTSWPTTG